jgi:hypothetical protein
MPEALKEEEKKAGEKKDKKAGKDKKGPKAPVRKYTQYEILEKLNIPENELE